MDQTGLIFDIKRFSIHDGPGLRTTVFFKGCPLHCLWCHNPESQSPSPEHIYREELCLRCGDCISACPESALSITSTGAVHYYAERCHLCGACVQACLSEARQIAGERRTVAQVMSQIERDLAFFDESGGGVTFSGGEPLFQPAFLFELLKACRQQEIRTALDTSGFAPWSALEPLLPYIDLFLYDLKLANETQHRRLTGVGTRQIHENLLRLSELGHMIILRIPIVPGCTDHPENLRSLAQIASSLPCLERVDLLPYHGAAAGKYTRLGQSYNLANLKSPSDQEMAQLASIFFESGLPVRIGG